MKFLKLSVILAVLLSAYVCFQKQYNMPVYDHFISRHMATFSYMNGFNQRENVDYIIVGDSTGLHNIQPNKLSVKADNLCLSGASTLDTYYVLQKLDLKKVRRGILLSSSFYASSHYGKHLWERFISTDFYSFNELMKIYSDSSASRTYPASEMSLPVFVFKIFSSKFYLYPEAVKAFFSFPAKYFSNKKTTLFFKNTIQKSRGFLPHLISYPIAPELFDEPYHQFYSRPFAIDPTDLLYLKKIIELAKENGLQVYLLAPVLADQAEKRNVETFKKSFRESFVNLEKDFALFHYVELPTSNRLSDFFDFNHLNERGANTLAPEISATIEKLGQK